MAPLHQHTNNAMRNEQNDKQLTEHGGAIDKPAVSRSFSAVLRSFGFKRCKSYSKGITCFISPCGRRYAEVYTETWGKWSWAVGDGLPSDTGYPGGKAYHEPHRLHEVLSSIGNTVLPAVDYSDRYKHIKTEENYMLLLKSGMFWEFHPELTGNWYLDEPVINGR